MNYFLVKITKDFRYENKINKKYTHYLIVGVFLGVNIVNCWFSMLFVELEGFEPSSKQAIHKISTCLFRY